MQSHGCKRPFANFLVEAEPSGNWDDGIDLDLVRIPTDEQLEIV
jgi:hypothetical protein